MQTLGRRSPVIVVGTRCMSGPRFLDPLWRHNGRSACGSKYPKPVPGDHLPTPGGPGRSGSRKNRKNHSFCENNGNFMKIADFLIFSVKISIFRLCSENGASRQPGVKMYCIRKLFGPRCPEHDLCSSKQNAFHIAIGMLRHAPL